MQIDYRCADCNAVFRIAISEREVRTTISGMHDECCPDCRQRVGYGTVQCDHCEEPFSARMPLRHALSKMSFGSCPKCREFHLEPVEQDKVTVGSL